MLEGFWYIAGESVAVRAGRPLAAVLCNQPLVLFRDGQGRVHALENRCPHKGVPLSSAWQEGDSLRCHFHGWRFTSSGECEHKCSPLSSLAKLWQRLNCYRDSLDAPDRERYCLEQTAFFNTLVGCEGHRCPVPCQFICTPCMRMTQDQSTVDGENRFEVATELAEIAWCPNLKVSGPGGQTGRALLMMDPGSTKG